MNRPSTYGSCPFPKDNDQILKSWKFDPCGFSEKAGYFASQVNAEMTEDRLKHVQLTMERSPSMGGSQDRRNQFRLVVP